MKYTLGLLVVIPQFTFACGLTGKDLDLMSGIFIFAFSTAAVGVPVYVLLRFLPRFKTMGIMWTLKWTGLVTLVFSLIAVSYVLYIARYSMCF
jgi:hypothetical protein